MDRNNVKDVYRIVGEDQEGKIYRLLDFKKIQEILKILGIQVTLKKHIVIY